MRLELDPLLPTTKCNHPGYKASHSNVTKIAPTPANACLKMNVCLFNIGSIGTNQKATLLKDFVLQEDIHCTIQTETWLQPGPWSTQQIGDITGPGFHFHHKPRAFRKGGGVGAICKSAIKVKPLEVLPVSSFEYLILHSKNSSIRIVIVY